jgi:hypothetical protein
MLADVEKKQTKWTILDNGKTYWIFFTIFKIETIHDNFTKTKTIFLTHF